MLIITAGKWKVHHHNRLYPLVTISCRLIITGESTTGGEESPGNLAVRSNDLLCFGKVRCNFIFVVSSKTMTKVTLQIRVGLLCLALLRFLALLAYPNVWQGGMLVKEKVAHS